MINVLLIIPNRGDATSFYRGMGPWGEMRKSREFNMICTDAIDWSIIRMADFVFMQRPFTPEHLKTIQMAKQWMTPVWVDYDDNLFDVPTDNPSHGLYMNTETHSRVAQIIALADVVTVSTEQLKRCLQLPKAPLNQRIYVVPNALMDCLVARKVPFSFKKQINWRGSPTHMKDVFSFGSEIAEVARDNPDTTFTFVGSNPWAVTDMMRTNQAIVVPPMSIGDYFEFMQKTNPPIQIVPLDESMFNKCKSNIAWIEATLAGGVCIGPAWQEWLKPGIITYETPADFKSCMEFALANPVKLEIEHELGWRYIRENLLLSHVNQQRFAIMDAITCGKFKGDHELYPLGNWPKGAAPILDDEVMQLQ